jgi:hypothetical protein
MIMFEKNDGERRYHGSELADGQMALGYYNADYRRCKQVCEIDSGRLNRCFAAATRVCGAPLVVSRGCLHSFPDQLAGRATPITACEQPE